MVENEISMLKSYISTLEDNLAFTYDKETIMKHRRKYYGKNAKEYVSFGELKEKIKLLEKKITELQKENKQLKEKVGNLQEIICDYYAIHRGLLITGNEISNIKIKKVKIEKFHHYLVNTGWVFKYFANGLYRVKKSFDNEPIVLIIPKDKSIPDYKFRMRQMINSLSIIENITVSKLIDKIQCKHKWNYQNAQGLTVYCEKCNLQTDPSGPPYLDELKI